MIEFTVSKVRELKGAPLACLVLLSLSSLPVSKEWLARTAGYTDKPISQALSYLQDQGYVGWSRSGWSLATLELENRRSDLRSDPLHTSTQDQESCRAPA